MNIEYICKQMVRVLHCDIVQLDKSGTIYKSYGNMAKLSNPLFTDPDFLNRINTRENKDYPDIFTEKQNIFYALLQMDNGRIIIGPISIEKQRTDLNRYMIETHHISEKTGFQLSFCELKVFGAGVLMLYHFITGNELSLNELWQKNEIKSSDVAEIKESVSNVIFEHQENVQPHNPYDQELRELDSIRNGDVERLKESIAETYRGEVGQLAKNQIRQAKNIAICVITLASRAAIAGGMVPEEAFSTVDGYILNIEDMDNAAKIDAMMRQAEYEFAEKVSDINNNRQKNELIERTKNYIFQHLHDDIIIGNIGMEIGVNNSYLSKLFHRVEGITIQQYIRKKKIHLAQNMLLYSEYDVKDIANYLAFCSQSYFGNVFKEEVGMTPIKYRKKYGKWKNKQNK